MRCYRNVCRSHYLTHFFVNPGAAILCPVTVFKKTPTLFPSPCRDKAGLVRPCSVVGAEAGVAASDILDLGEVWRPRRCQPGVHAPAQAPEAGPAQRLHRQAPGLLLWACVPHCAGHL